MRQRNSPTPLRLRAGDTQLDLVPSIGGAVARFRWREVHLFRPATAMAIARGDVLGMASFPMAPFAGRIHDGQFAFDGHDVRLRANLEGETDAIHGGGWQAPWTVIDADETTAILRYDHPADDWPWAYRAEQIFTLADGVLIHRLTVSNRSTSAMPAGVGLHPYFPRPAGTRLQAGVDRVFLAPDQPPSTLPTAWDWRQAPVIDAFVDHQFEGWGGHATVSWPTRGIALSLSTEPAASRLVVFAPAGEDYVCVEPVSHQLDAVNRSPGGGDHGMTLLPPGETLSMAVRFEGFVLV